MLAMMKNKREPTTKGKTGKKKPSASAYIQRARYSFSHVRKRTHIARHNRRKSMFSQAENNYPSIFHSLAQPQTAFCFNKEPKRISTKKKTDFFVFTVPHGAASNDALSYTFTTHTRRIFEKKKENKKSKKINEKEEVAEAVVEEKAKKY